MSRARDPHAGLRLALGAALPAGLVALAVVPLVILWSRLPEPMATHWSLSGQADGSMSRPATLALQAGLTLLPAGLVFAFSRMSSERHEGFALGLAGAASAAAFFALLSVLVVAANMDQSDWRQADLATVLLIPAVGVAGSLAWVVGRVARGLEQPSPAPARDAPSIGLEGTERAAWVGGATSRWAFPVSALCLVLATVAMVLAVPIVSVALAVTAVVTATFTSVRVTAGASGLRVTYGRLPWPSTRIGIERISHAGAVDVKPSAWGGWGYRGSLRLMGRAAVVLRAGDGLRLDLESERVFLVTVDDAEVAAGVLNDELRRAGRLNPR